jgi:hypothetical protein
MKETIKPGTIWSTGLPNRPDIEIVRFNEYANMVIWNYVAEKNVYDTPVDQFLKQYFQKNVDK